MQRIVVLFCVFLINFSFSQKLITRTGEVKFEASVPAFEEIAAKSNTASCVLDKSNGEIAALILVKAFKFKVPLMEEHFNENYIQSDKYPKATFKGKAIGFESSKLNKATVYEVEGDLTLHGVTKKVKTKLTFTPSGNKIIITGSFVVKPSDFNIQIPSVVKSKIAETVKIMINFELSEK